MSVLVIFLRAVCISCCLLLMYEFVLSSFLILHIRYACEYIGTPDRIHSSNFSKKLSFVMDVVL